MKSLKQQNLSYIDLLSNVDVSFRILNGFADASNTCPMDFPFYLTQIHENLIIADQEHNLIIMK